MTRQRFRREQESAMINPCNRSEQSGSETDESSPSTRADHWQKDWQLISCALAVVLLVLAVEETWQDDGYSLGDGLYTLEEPFFKFLHIYITSLALVLAFTFWKQSRAIWLVAAILLAILFNPIMPIEIESWVGYYFIACGWFAFLAISSPSVKMAKDKRREVLLEQTSGNTTDSQLASSMAARPQSLTETDTNTVDFGAFDGKRLRTTLYWGVTLATLAEFFLRSVLSGGEDRGTNVLVFVAIGGAAWLIGRLYRSESAAVWTFGLMSLGFLVLLLSRFVT
jgi:hypothetical protein